MTKKSASVRDKQTFRKFLIPEFLTVCSDAIIAADQTVSLIRLIDQVAAFAYPIPLTRFVVVAQLSRNDEVPIEDFARAQVAHKLILVNPKGDVTDLGENKPVLNPEDPWTTTRSIFDLSGRIALKQPGLYKLKLLGRIADGEYEEIIEKRFPAVLVTGLPGFYSAYFTAEKGTSDPMKQGVGFVLLSPDGSIQGGDSGYEYHGEYRTANDKVHADLIIRRRDPAAQSIYGDIEEFGLRLEGAIEGDAISFQGHRTEDPKQPISLVLTKQTVIPGSAT